MKTEIKPKTRAGSHTACYLTLVLIVGLGSLFLAQKSSASGFQYDPGFGMPDSSGTVVFEDHGAAASILSLPNRKFLVGGYRQDQDSNRYRPIVKMLSGDGSVDLSYGAEGFAAFPAVAATEAYVSAITKAPGGKTFVLGQYRPSRNQAFLPMLFRLDSNGNLDGSFRPYLGNRVRFGRHDLNDLAVDRHGRVTAIGDLLPQLDRKQSILLLKFRSDGRPALNFGRDGHLLLASRKKSVNVGTRILSDDRDRLTVAGIWHGRPFVARITGRGEFDPKFADGNGLIYLSPAAIRCSPRSCYVVDMVRIEGGKLRILIDRKISQFDAASIIIGLDSNGTFDRKFAQRATLRLKTGASPKGGVGLVPVNSSDVVAIDSTDTGSRMMQISPRGRINRAFGSRGVIRVAGEYALAGKPALDGGFLVSSIKFGVRGLVQRFVPRKDP